MRGFRVEGLSRRRGVTVAAVLAACSLALMGCGSTKSSSGGTGTSAASGTSGAPASGKITSSELASLKAAITKAEAVPTWTAPGPAVSASVLKGKNLFVMAINNEISACNAQEQDFTALGRQLGAHVTAFSDSGVPTQWVQGIEQAAAAKSSAIVMLCGIIPGAVGPQLQSAEKAGAVVVDGNYNETSDYQLLNAETAVQTAQSLALDVDDAVVNLNGKPLHALYLGSLSVIQGAAAEASVDSTVKKDCSACTVSNLNVPIQNWATAIQSDVSSRLVANPDINAVFIAFDGMTQFALPAVESAHRSGLKIYTWGAGNTVEELLTSPGDYVAADPGPDEDWDAYEAMDQVIRLLNHKPAAPVDAEVDPDRFLVASNINGFFGPNHSYGNGAFGGSTFINDFDHLWGVK